MDQVAKLDSELVGVIQGSIKVVTVPHNLAKVGYILGLRVAPLHRRKGLGLRLVCAMEEWFAANEADYAYTATDKHNEASVRLFVRKLGYTQFRTPSILANAVRHKRPSHISSSVEIAKLKLEESESVYRKLMESMEFFPQDIDQVLRNKLSLGTWVAYQRGKSWSEDQVPESWAMVSVWNSGEVFKLRLEDAPLSCLMYTKSSRLIDRYLPCFGLVPSIPDFFQPFGFYFMYGVHREGPLSGKLVRNLCHFVHNMAAETAEDCKVVVTEIGDHQHILRHHIPHRKMLSCPEDLWCIKALKFDEKNSLFELTKTPPTKALFVDPREV